jgi:hypothetical protein
MTTRKTKSQSQAAAEKLDDALNQKSAAKQQKSTKPPPQKKPTARRKPTPASWVKGQSGNPKGRPKKGNAWADIINQMMESKGVTVTYTRKDADGNPVKETIDINAGRLSIRQVMAANMLKQALEGDNATVKTLIEHEVGRAMQMNMNANLTPEDLPNLKKGDDPIAILLAKFAKG